jgi:hypothetical protein
MPLFNAEEIIGKTLFAKGFPVNLRQYASTEAPIISKTQPGEIVGQVYSYLNKPDGVWWQIQRPTGGAVWARHNPAAFDLKALKEQGVKSTEERRKEEEEKALTPGEKFIKSFERIGIIVAAIAGAIALIKATKKK